MCFSYIGRKLSGQTVYRTTYSEIFTAFVITNVVTDFTNRWRTAKFIGELLGSEND